MTGETNQVLWRGVRPVAGIQGVWPAIGATRVNAEGSEGEGGTSVIYTVPAGKKLFISLSLLTGRLDTIGVQQCYVSVRDAGDVTKFSVSRQFWYAASQQTTPCNYLPALEVPAGWDVCLTSTSANLDVWCGIYGWLEDA